MKNWVVLVMIIGVWFYLALAQSTQEELTITTYYPAPYSTYYNLSWGCQNQDRSIARLVRDQGGSIELGGYNCSDPNPTSRARPYIKFYATNWGELRATIRSNINELTINGSDPAIFRAKIVGNLYVNNWIWANRTNPTSEIRGRLGRNVSAGYEKRASSENDEGDVSYPSVWCNDGDYIAGMRVKKNRVEGGDFDKYGIYIKCYPLY